MLKAAKAYLATQVSTASQGDLLLMLYDTAIKHLRQAIDEMRAGNVAAKGILITKALEIISELQECLNKERGGDIAKNLFNLYFFCNTRLLQANMSMKPEMVEEVITILNGLRTAFAQILPTQDGVASLAQPQAAMRQGALCPRPEDSPAAGAAEVGTPAPENVQPVGQPAAEAEAAVVEAAVVEAAPAALAPEPMTGPVNPVRFRAANAYANTR